MGNGFRPGQAKAEAVTPPAQDLIEHLNQRFATVPGSFPNSLDTAVEFLLTKAREQGRQEVITYMVSIRDNKGDL